MNCVPIRYTPGKLTTPPSWRTIPLRSRTGSWSHGAPSVVEVDHADIGNEVETLFLAARFLRTRGFLNEEILALLSVLYRSCQPTGLRSPPGPGFTIRSAIFRSHFPTRERFSF